MAKREHLSQLEQGVKRWNQWRTENPTIAPDLRDANLREKDLCGINLRGAKLAFTQLSDAQLRRANLSAAILDGTYLIQTDLRDTDISRAHLHGAYLDGANLSNANLGGAILRGAHFTAAKLIGANLQGANLEEACLVYTNLERANLTDCSTYGISVWNVNLKGAIQTNLRITPDNEPTVQVDDIEVAQFIYLLLKSEKVRSIIDTIGQRGVLILGRFGERKYVLDAIRDKLREIGFLPMMFEFERPTQRDFTETIKILAGLSRFIIADITNPKSSPLELQAIMPDYMIPFVPIIQANEQPFSMFSDLKNKYGDWVLDVLSYNSVDEVVANLKDEIVKPALAKSDELAIKKARALVVRPITQHR